MLLSSYEFRNLFIYFFVINLCFFFSNVNFVLFLIIKIAKLYEKKIELRIIKNYVFVIF